MDIQGEPAEMTRLCMHISQLIFEIYLYLVRYFKDILLQYAHSKICYCTLYHHDVNHVIPQVIAFSVNYIITAY